MPRYRDVYIEKSLTLADSGTETIELAVIDPISEIHIRFKAKNGGTSNKNNPIARNISKIEIIDGANVIYSLDGMTAQAMSYYQRRVLPFMQRQGGPSENQEEHFILRFGRALWDREYGLVPNTFRNLQLKITWNLATVTAVGATGFLSNSAKLTIIARIMEDLATSPIAYMMAKSHFAWTTAASGDERISLPTDHPYVLMMLRAWESTTKLQSTIDNLKLSIDQDKEIPFDLDSEDFIHWMENEYGLFTLEQHIFAADQDTIETWLGSGETLVVTPETASGGPTTFRAHLHAYGIDSGHFTLASQGSDHSTGSEDIIQMIARGQCLNHCFVYPFGLMAEPDSWLPAPDRGDIKAIITQGNAGAAADLVLLQARPYA